MTILLATSSPRRIQILTRSNIPFEAMASGIDERPPQPLGPLRLVAWAARAKAEAVAAKASGRIVVAADTEVVLHGRVFGKPKDSAEAAEFLSALSGKTHQVYTAVHVIDGRSGRRAHGMSRTHVTMRELSAREIAAYVRTREPQDKAGAYAIQGKGRRLIASIRGPYDNVVGMPMRLLTRLLGECGIPVPANNPDEFKRLKRSHGTTNVSKARIARTRGSRGATPRAPHA